MMESEISNNNTKNQKHSATQNRDTYSAAGICPPGNQRNKVKQETAQKELTNDTHFLMMIMMKITCVQVDIVWMPDHNCYTITHITVKHSQTCLHCNDL